mmetsp:Transcript_143168/g.202458  ORF Transcript_143168/g.202458 Transcript_143168/m.202458 type:complete len:147 (+) Transcript_143168:102-542(+)
MPKRAKFNTPIRRDLPPDDADFVEVAHTDVPNAAEVAGAVVSTTARAVKGAAAAAVVTAAVNYAESAAVSYTLETVGVTTILKGAYTVASTVIPPIVNTAVVVGPAVATAAGTVASAAATTPGMIVVGAVGAKCLYDRATATTVEG